MKPAYTVTTDTITLVWEGKPHTVKRGAPNFAALRKALLNEEWEEVPKHLTVRKSVEAWAEGSFKIEKESVTYKGEPLPEHLHSRILKMVTAGEDPGPLCRFWERLERNPSFRSVNQLFPFLSHEGIPITEDGCFLAYKAVRHDFKDVHSGTVDNSVGTVHEMPRNKISDDPRTPCHYGFHVGALGYARTFGPSDRKMIICKVDPADVVCVPYDSSQQKMRVCAYEVVGLYGQEMPSTVISSDDIPVKPKPTTAKTGPVSGGGLAPKPKKEDSKAGMDLSKPKPAKTDSGRASQAKGESDPSMWEGYEDLDFFGLMDKPLDNLRRYARFALKIVGASKIRGGKTALVEAIVKARG